MVRCSPMNNTPPPPPTRSRAEEEDYARTWSDGKADEDRAHIVQKFDMNLAESERCAKQIDTTSVERCEMPMDVRLNSSEN